MADTLEQNAGQVVLDEVEEGKPDYCVACHKIVPKGTGITLGSARYHSLQEKKEHDNYMRWALCGDGV